MDISGGDFNANSNFFVGHGANGILNISGGTLDHIDQQFSIALLGGTGVVNQTGGAVTALQAGPGPDSDRAFIGIDAGSTGTYNISNGTFDTSAGTLLGVGRLGGTGTVNQSNTGNVTTRELWIGWDGGSTGTYNISGGTLQVNDRLGLGRVTGTGTMNITGGTVNVTNNIVDDTGTGTINIDGGTLNLGGAQADIDHLRVGQNANGSHSIGAGKTYNVNTQLIVGNNGNTGTVTQTGGAVNALLDGPGPAGQWAFIGANGGTGTYNISGGTLDTSAGTLMAVGGGQGSGTGTVNQSGGSTVTSRELWIGWNGRSTGDYNISSGTLNVNDRLGVGRFGGTGTLTQSGGTVNVTNNVFVTADNGAAATGTINVDGGVFNANSNVVMATVGGSVATFNVDGGTVNVSGNITDGAGTSNLNVDSGTANVAGDMTVDNLRVGNSGGNGTLNLNNAGVSTVNSSITFGGNVGTINQVAGGTLNLADVTATGTNLITGGTVDLNGNRIFNVTGGETTISSVLTGGAGETLTKDGAGTLVLDATNTYDGPTTVNGGVLRVQSGDAMPDNQPVSVNNATLQMAASETIARLSLNNGSVTDAGALTLNSNVPEAITSSGTSLQASRIRRPAAGSRSASARTCTCATSRSPNRPPG